MYNTCASLHRQNIVQLELVQENCSSPFPTDRNVPKELTSALSIDGFQKAWMHGEGKENKPKIYDI